MDRNFGSGQRQSTMIQFAKSREQLIHEQKLSQTSHSVARRRTKIIATIGKKTNSFEMLQKMYQAGANHFLLNLAYITNKDLMNLQQYRQKLEDQYQVRIPLTSVLKGTLTRIGNLIKPEISLKKGQTYRLIVKKEIVGDNCICSVDDEYLHRKIKVGDKLLVDQGQVCFTITDIENSDQTLEILRKDNAYDDNFQKPLDLQIKSNLPHMFNNNNNDDDQTNDNSGVFNDSQHENQQQEQDVELNYHNNELINKMKNKKKKTYKVIVCTVDCDCAIKSYKPIFIYQNKQVSENFEKQLEEIRERKKSYQASKPQISESSSSEDEGFLTPKDLNDLDSSCKFKIDQVCLTNVKTVDEVKEVKKQLKNSPVRIIVKIQTREAVENFEKILKYADGIILSRSYLVIHYPVEKLFHKMKWLIQTCHSYMKPIQISCNILETMISTLLPTTAEVGEIASLVDQFVDGIILSQETTVGEYPIEVVETLSRICVEQEAAQVKRLIDNPTARIPVSIQSSNAQNTILNSIVFCVLEAAYRIPASLVLAFTQTGSIILKMSKLRMPCPIIATTPDFNLARNINTLAGVYGRHVNIQKNRSDFENLIPQILSQAVQQNLCKKGDFVIITMFESDQKGSTNTMKIQQID